jgi:diketogulonate reductase-like aldo/keto reductase
LDPIVAELIRIGEKEGKSPSAVALNWTICKGAIPIPTPKNKEQAEDSLQALGWRLKKQDEERLDALGLVNAPDWNILKHFQNWYVLLPSLLFIEHGLTNLRWWQQG